MTRPQEILLIGRTILRDVARRRSGWMTTALGGLVFAGLFIGLGFTSERVAIKADQRSFRVAVGDPDGGGSRFIELLEADPRLVAVLVDEPEAKVTERDAAVGLVLPARADEALAAGEPLELTVYRRTSEAVSLEASTLLLTRLHRIEVFQQGDGVGLPVDPVLSTREVARDPRVNRIELGAPFAAILCLLCLAVTSSAASVLGSASDRRSREAFLLLPVHRSSLTTGVAMGAFPLATLQLAIAVTIISACTLLPVDSLDQSLRSALEIAMWAALGSVLLGGLAVAAGALAGALGTGSDDAVSIGDLLAVPFVVVGATLFLSPELDPSWPMQLIPVLGQALFVRDGIDGSLGPVQGVLAVLAAVFWFAVTCAYAGRKVADERRVIRASG